MDLSITGSIYAAEKKLTVVATIFPLYDFAREIGGDKVAVTKLLPPGVEAHAFELKPQDVVRINKADIFIYTGKYMEPWVEDLLKGVLDKNLEVVDTSNGIEFINDDERGSKDPHIWLDLSRAQKMTQTIAESFAEKDPPNKEFYLDNAKEYNLKLAGLDVRIKAALSSCKIKTIIYAGHYTFGYFAKRYGLKHVSPYNGFSPNAEPSPKNIKELIDMIKKTGSKYIYYEELIEPKAADIIAEETGAKPMLLSGAHNVSKEDMARGITFLSIMEYDLENLKTGLECK